jgi:hypothetical protein
VDTAIKIGLLVVGILLLGAGLVALFRGTGASHTAAGSFGSASLNLPLPGFLIVLGVACFVIAYVVNPAATERAEPSSSSPPSISQVPSPSPSAGGEATGIAGPPDSSRATSVVTIDSPENGHRISAKEGIVIGGAATNLGSDETVWLLDYDPQDQEHPYYQVNTEPIKVTNERWSFKDAPIGSGADPIGAKYYVVAVKATGHCASGLSGAAPNQDGDVTFRKLPDGCYSTSPLMLVKARP